MSDKNPITTGNPMKQNREKYFVRSFYIPIELRYQVLISISISDISLGSTIRWDFDDFCVFFAFPCHAVHSRPQRCAQPPVHSAPRKIWGGGGEARRGNVHHVRRISFGQRLGMRNAAGLPRRTTWADRWVCLLRQPRTTPLPRSRHTPVRSMHPPQRSTLGPRGEGAGG